MSAGPRPRRARLRPLEYWANERVVYEQTAQGVPTITGVLTDDPRVAASAAASRAGREDDEQPPDGNGEHSSLPSRKAAKERVAEVASLPKKRKADTADKRTGRREQEPPLPPTSGEGSPRGWRSGSARP